MLPVEAPFKPIVIISFTNGEVIQGDAESMFKQADEWVFYEGWMVSSIVQYDEEYRKKLLDAL